MKIGWLLIPLFLAGCQYASVSEVNLVRNHSPFVSEQLFQKAPVYWAVTLNDEWNGTEYSVVMNEYGYLTADLLNEAALGQFARELANQIDTPMQNPKINESGMIIPGKERVILAEKELVEQLQALPVGKSELSLPIYVTEPNVSEEDLQGIDEKIIGEFITYFDSSVVGRSQNIALSAQAITDVVIGSGDLFSFNQTVGERTVVRGYQEAMEIINKEFVLGIGGGICQTSTTLFNAVEKAGLEMIERYTHSREVGYVSKGRDATVSWGGPDFRFTNPHPYPILIRSKVNLERGELIVTIHSHK